MASILDSDAVERMHLQFRSTFGTSCSDAPEDFLAPLGQASWTAQSGREVPHTVYSLIGCPAIRAATYILVRRRSDGVPQALAVGRTHSDTPTLNLAWIRQEGALRGANEVHLHLETASEADRARTEFDLASKLLDTPGATSEVVRAPLPAN